MVKIKNGFSNPWGGKAFVSVFGTKLFVQDSGWDGWLQKSKLKQLQILVKVEVEAELGNVSYHYAGIYLAP